MINDLSGFTWIRYRADPIAEDGEETDVAVDQAEITAEEVRKIFCLFLKHIPQFRST